MCFFEIGLFLLVWQSKTQRQRRIQVGKNFYDVEIVPEKKPKKHLVKSIAVKISCIILAVVIPVLWGWLHVDAYLEVEEILKNNEYKTVTGSVEEFQTMIGGKDVESFVIDGQLFEYSEYIEAPGYHSTYHHGGVVRSNGQKLCIDYYVNSDGENVILRIIDVGGEE